MGKIKSWVIRDPVRQKYLVDGPEERVRQGFISFLTHTHGVPPGLISVEKSVPGSARSYRFDIVVHDRGGNPWMVVECKAPEIAVEQQGFDQLGRYNQYLKAPFMLLTNGIDHYCCSYDQTSGGIDYLEHLPVFPAITNEPD